MDEEMRQPEEMVSVIDGKKVQDISMLLLWTIRIL